MTNSVALRTAKDRIRYTLLFEATLMAMIVPVGAAFFDKSLANIGLLMAILSVNAMICNLIYNWTFDRLEARQGRISSERTWPRRLLHAAGFELMLTAMSLPINTYWLEIGVLEALSVNIAVTFFVVAYTYLFTFAYDLIFPLRHSSERPPNDAVG
ncbi:PACE efflux transporter [Shimia sp. R11_0]|uniref:PACE efflux transporter n=1 Tax=Shimia sp. R11_0 TaxID=2821096 RepID=UPI001ADA77F0|nr:PACE efflux transporter [Shimia sp. R11_0]MBO9477731.1 PACE efflux transporter [Shimia sp. R11_0]